MMTFFISRDLWDFVKEGYADTENYKQVDSSKQGEKLAEVKEFRKKDAKALLVLQQAVTETFFQGLLLMLYRQRKLGLLSSKRVSW